MFCSFKLRTKINDILSERHFDDSMPWISSSNYMIKYHPQSPQKLNPARYVIKNQRSVHDRPFCQNLSYELKSVVVFFKELTITVSYCQQQQNLQEQQHQQLQ